MVYECHITIALADAEIGEKVAEKFHWSTSQIERDPVLGKASYFYLTTHSKDFAEIEDRMNVATETLGLLGALVIREKIEQIIYDTKLGGRL
jgi:hypothetical protein